jgi:hypothetical protein
MTNNGMQRSGGGKYLGEINVNSRGPLIPVVRPQGGLYEHQAYVAFHPAFGRIG